MIVNDLLQNLGSEICVLFRLNDCKWSLTKNRSPKNVSYWDSMIFNDLLHILCRPTNVFIWSLWLSMISYKTSVAQICVLFRLDDLFQSLGRPNMFFLFVLYDHLWSLTKLRSHKYVSYLGSMIVNDLLQSLGRPKMFFLFDLYDRQWSLTQPCSPKYVSYLDSMIINDLLQSLGRPIMCLI